MANVEMMRRVRDVLVLFPERHDQDHWICKTGEACIAGTTVLLDGWVPFGVAEDVGNGRRAYSNVIKNGHVMDIETLAAQLLGLAEKEDYAALFFNLAEADAIKELDRLIAEN